MQKTPPRVEVVIFKFQLQFSHFSAHSGGSGVDRPLFAGYGLTCVISDGMENNLAIIVHCCGYTDSGTVLQLLRTWELIWT